MRTEPVPYYRGYGLVDFVVSSSNIQIPVEPVFISIIASDQDGFLSDSYFENIAVENRHGDKTSRDDNFGSITIYLL